jgi:AAA+ superfamily predicted ATPase
MRRRIADPDPDDGFRGLYVSDEGIVRLFEPRTPLLAEDPAATAVDELEDKARDAEEAGADLRLRTLARTFGLDGIDVDLLLVALAPDLDDRFERLYGYLHDDVTRRRASSGLALELAGALPTTGAARARLLPGGPLVDQRLVLVGDGERPFLTRSLRVPDRVAMHLLGDDRPDPVVERLVVEERPFENDLSRRLGEALAGGVRLAYVRQPRGLSGFGTSTAAMARAGSPALLLDLSLLGPDEDVPSAAGAIEREAGLLRGGIVAGPVEALAGRGPPAVRALADIGAPMILTGARSWDPAWSRRVPLVVEGAPPTPDEQSQLWRLHLDGGLSPGVDPGAVTAGFRLGSEQIARASLAAGLHASAEGRPVARDDIVAGVRGQNSAALEALARRIEPRVGWEDLVLPREVGQQLRELASWTRQRHRVLREWAMRGAGSQGEGIAALFAGPSGTGKTMAAEVMAGELGVELYAVDLATVVDKYIGETEKNLDRIFSEAEGVNAVLFFDEADALFGKRSEVRDAHDRYANIEVAYLLQRMERFDGIAIMATNLRANLDDAFTRRLDAVVEFPMPEEEHRRLLWERSLGRLVPRGPDLDLDFMARAFEVSGGNIRNIALAAAYRAADSGEPVSMADLIQAAARELRKMGRLLHETEFGPYYPLLG